MMTAKDPETNILRTTIACFAAAAGGADSISILPHTIAHGLPEGFARRIARNTQLILADESHVDFVADPAAGSGGVEALTDALCEAAWDEFQPIETEGGILRQPRGRQDPVADRRGTRQSAPSEYRDGKRADRRHDALSADSRSSPVDTLAGETAARLPTDGAVFCERLAAAAHRPDRSETAAMIPDFSRHRLAEAQASSRRGQASQHGRRRKALR